VDPTIVVAPPGYAGNSDPTFVGIGDFDWGTFGSEIVSNVVKELPGVAAAVLKAVVVTKVSQMMAPKPSSGGSSAPKPAAAPAQAAPSAPPTPDSVPAYTEGAAPAEASAVPGWAVPAGIVAAASVIALFVLGARGAGR
jgi:hypothetical protein